LKKERKEVVKDKIKKRDKQREGFTTRFFKKNITKKEGLIKKV